MQIYNMFEQLLDLAKNNLGNLFNEHADVPVEQKEQAASVASETVINNISNQAKDGNYASISELLSGQETDGNNAVAGNMMPDVVNNLIKKVGLSPEVAQTMAAKAVPSILNMLNSKVSSAKSSGGFDISSILSNLGGGQASGASGGGILGFIKNLFGGNKANSSANSGGGSNPMDSITNAIKGLLG